MAKLFANSEGPDQTPHSAASDLGLQCLPITLLGVSWLQLVKDPVNNIKIMLSQSVYLTTLFLIVCVEVLRPSQPNGVMSSAVSLPNHTFTGQA